MLRRIPRTRFARTDLQSSTTDAIAHGTMVGFGETYIPAFALAIGAGEILSGLITTLPMLAGGLIQLIAPHAAYRIRSRRTWVVTAAVGQALAFVPLALGAIQGWLPAWGLLLAVSMYWGMGLATGPVWNTWIDTLVPAKLRAGYFARRTRLAQAALVVGIVVGGMILNRSAGTDRLLAAFALIFALAFLGRAISALALWSQREPCQPRDTEKPAPVHRALIDVWNSPVRGLMTFLLCIQASVFVSAPFFNAYMLVRIELSYADYLMVLATAYIAKIAALSYLGGFARRMGVRRLLLMGSIGIVPLPAMWLISHEVWFLLVIQVLSGIAWGAYELGMFLVLFNEVPSARRTDMLTIFNVGNVSATALGSLVGVALMKGLPDPWLAYAAIFIASMLGRLVTLIVLWPRQSREQASNPDPDRQVRNHPPTPRRAPRVANQLTLADSVF